MNYHRITTELLIHSRNISLLFIFTALIILLCTVWLGVIAALQFLLPEQWSEWTPFYSIRPLHTSYAVFWILMGAMGCVQYFFSEKLNGELYSNKISGWQFMLMVAALLIISLDFSVLRFGGREYFEFKPYTAVLIVVAWGLWFINFYKSIAGKLKRWPVYMWMWCTGIIFFILTFSEGYLTLLPFFKNNIIRDITTQWKSLGALVGSWNMLVYGIGFYLIEKITKDEKPVYSRLAFFLYFIGLLNLILGWAHHTYHLPQALWIKQFAYGINMLELIILAKVIYDCFKIIPGFSFKNTPVSGWFLMITDIWIILNLLLALFLSVPVFNTLGHGTHMVTAHAMGSTIGINTMILLSACFYIVENFKDKNSSFNFYKVKTGFWILQFSLLVFFISLIWAGWVRGNYMLTHTPEEFSGLIDILVPYLWVFAISGSGVALGITLLAGILMEPIYEVLFK